MYKILQWLALTLWLQRFILVHLCSVQSSSFVPMGSAWWPSIPHLSAGWQLEWLSCHPNLSSCQLMDRLVNRLTSPDTWPEGIDLYVLLQMYVFFSYISFVAVKAYAQGCVFGSLSGKVSEFIIAYNALFLEYLSFLLLFFKDMLFMKSGMLDICLNINLGWTLPFNLPVLPKMIQ